MDESLFPSYLNNGAIRTAATSAAPVSSQAEVPAKPFALNFAPPPAVYVPPLATINSRTQAGQPTPRATPLGAPPSDNGLPKGVPANAIPVIRGMDLSYDIPGTGQRLYPTINGGVSQYSPDQRFELARYTEPAQIHAGAEVQSAGIRSAGEVAATTGAARIAQAGALQRDILQANTTPRPAGQDVVMGPDGLAHVVTTFAAPQVDAQNPTALPSYGAIGTAAKRDNQKPQPGMFYDAPDGNYNGFSVKDKRITSVK